jgi:hypothetical protein
MNRSDRDRAKQIVEGILGENVEAQAEITERIWKALDWAVKNNIHPVVVLYVIANYENALVRELAKASKAFESKSEKWKEAFTQELLKAIFALSLQESDKAVKYVETGDTTGMEHKIPFIEEMNKKKNKTDTDAMFR